MESKPTKKVRVKQNLKKKKKNSKLNESDEIEEKSKQVQEKISVDEIELFEDFPISSRTCRGLSDAGFTKPTEIQKDGISIALRGLDVLGAAKTGSGKTLAFLIPVIELLWRNKWGSENGLGALIISPTRELALQIFQVLRKIGKHHDFSAGLVIGGKSIEEEQARIQTTNIIICTPGRLLQHFDETPNFHCYELQVLVLDEADRILDLGFAETMNAIIENLPTERQTLLYSATQTKSVKDLARLSLNRPEYIAVHENAKYVTPKKLVQSYAVIELQNKINFLYSFIKNHLKTKSIIFLSCCKQVKFLYEVFRKVRPGIPLLALYGKMKQLKRMGVYNRFCNSENILLFATDIAARGLDFPGVNWVIQFDCPENTDTYIHRVGRTARYEKGGQALLMLLPSEIEMINKLKEKKIPVHEIKPNPKKLRSINGKLQALCAQNQEIKNWAQKSIISYARSVFLQSEKTVFNVTKLPIEEFSVSCGLLAAPKIRFMKKLEKKIGPSHDDKNANLHIQTTKGKLAIEKVDHQSSNDSESQNDSDEDDVLVKKTTNQIHENIDIKQSNEELNLTKKTINKITTKTSLAKKILRKNIKMNTKITFDEEGDVIEKDNDNEEIDISSKHGGIDVEKAKIHMIAEDKKDRSQERERIKKKHRAIRQKEREERKLMVNDGVMLGNGSDNDESMESEDEIQPPIKKRWEEESKDHSSTINEDEELALHLLGVN